MFADRAALATADDTVHIDFDAGLGKGEMAAAKAHLTVLTKRYPFYTDFDFVGTRPYVLYED